MIVTVRSEMCHPISHRNVGMHVEAHATIGIAEGCIC